MTVPVDPGTGLQDGVDFVLLAGLSGIHARFAPLYQALNPAQIGIQADNVDLSDDFNFTGLLQQDGEELVRVLETVTGIDGKVATTTSLLTVPTSKRAIITGAMLRLTAVSALSGTLACGIGVAAGEDDIFPSTSLIGFNAANEVYMFMGSGVRVSAAAGSVIKLGIDTAFTGTTATLECQLLGYYR